MDEELVPVEEPEDEETEDEVDAPEDVLEEPEDDEPDDEVGDEPEDVVEDEPVEDDDPDPDDDVGGVEVEGGGTSYANALDSKPLWPLGFWTTTGTLPVPRGVIAWIWLELVTIQLGAEIVPKDIFAPGKNPWPLIVTNVPPAVGPWAGEMVLIVNAWFGFHERRRDFDAAEPGWAEFSPVQAPILPARNKVSALIVYVP